jgi:hypothetical protein
MTTAERRRRRRRRRRSYSKDTLRTRRTLCPPRGGGWVHSNELFGGDLFQIPASVMNYFYLFFCIFIITEITESHELFRRDLSLKSVSASRVSVVCLSCVCRVSVVCLSCVCRVSVVCLSCVWLVSGLCLSVCLWQSAWRSQCLSFSLRCYPRRGPGGGPAAGAWRAHFSGSL